MANLFSQVRDEMNIVCNDMYQYRPNKAFTDLERAFGLHAYYFWISVGAQEIQNKNWGYFQGANNSARELSIDYVKNIIYPRERQVKAALSDFDALAEIGWGMDNDNDNNGKWDLCLTRAIVLLCRGTAYRFVGIGQKSKLLSEQIEINDLCDISKKWIVEAVPDFFSTEITSLYDTYLKMGMDGINNSVKTSEKTNKKFKWW